MYVIVRYDEEYHSNNIIGPFRDAKVAVRWGNRRLEDLFWDVVELDLPY